MTFIFIYGPKWWMVNTSPLRRTRRRCRVDETDLDVHRQPSSFPQMSTLDELLRHLGSDSRAQRIGQITVALIGLMVLETLAGLMLGSIGLLADALHLLFHSVALMIALYGVLSTKRSATFAYSYGFARYEVLAAFSNAVMLIFLQLFLVAGVVHRLVEPGAFVNDPREGGGKLVLGSVGLCLNIWAVMQLGTGPRDQLERFRVVGSSSSSSSGKGGGGGGITEGGASLQVYSDAVSSALLVTSALVGPYIGPKAADVLQAMCSAAFTLYLALPLASATATALLQGVPASHAAAVERAGREVSAIEGVLEVTAQHFWLQAPGHGVCTAVLRVRQEANDAAVLGMAKGVYSQIARDVAVQIMKDQGPMEDWRQVAKGGAGGGGGGGGGGVEGVVQRPVGGGHSHGAGGTCSHEH